MPNFATKSQDGGGGLLLTPGFTDVLPVCRVASSSKVASQLAISSYQVNGARCGLCLHAASHFMQRQSAKELSATAVSGCLDNHTEEVTRINISHVKIRLFYKYYKS